MHYWNTQTLSLLLLSGKDSYLLSLNTRAGTLGRWFGSFANPKLVNSLWVLLHWTVVNLTHWSYENIDNTALNTNMLLMIKCSSLLSLFVFMLKPLISCFMLSFRLNTSDTDLLFIVLSLLLFKQMVGVAGRSWLYLRNGTCIVHRVSEALYPEGHECSTVVNAHARW